ncbi:MAG: HAMP domain-containing histidine kinase [Pegethrix bostrychoides GSE-TBD4-15B]|uniref:histidine kinase n=1 Tax=Pegethrix bostrychoides GSE-TBD4-15B TaxID=2839662 RepID=A0A951PDS8_9CYAN|nr:HAMP domain-containing histidine kinase [Pegethrix bostrychoides GSE-TBD4-15B]
MQPPQPPNETQRLNALHRYGILDSEAEAAFDDLTRLAAQVCEVPIALISLVDGHRQWFKSKVGLDASETPRELHKGTKRIQQLVCSLRTFSRLDEADLKTVDLHENLDSALMLLQHRLQATADRPEIQILKKYGDLPPVECYASQLNQAILYLLNNAIDALALGVGATLLPEAPQITIETAPIAKSGAQSGESGESGSAQALEQAAVIITDNGCGIAESVQSRMFNPFFTTKPMGEGNGLGLALSHQIVVGKHGGKLGCTSQSGAVSQFRLEIPLRSR